MRIESQQLGPVEIPDSALVSFPHGIPGFPQARQFCLLEVRPGSRFKLLQSAERADLAFVVTDPLLVDPDYPLRTVQDLASRQGLEADEPLAVAVIVTVAVPSGMTANLFAPLAMGTRTRLGVQVILHDSPYQVRHAL